VYAPQVAAFGEVPLNKEFMGLVYRHMLSGDILDMIPKKQADSAHCLYGWIFALCTICFACYGCRTGNSALQLFHLWHTLPGFSFFIAPQKIASLSRILLLKGFFIPAHLLSPEYIYSFFKWVFLE
jgi:hypothetical protein